MRLHPLVLIISIIVVSPFFQGYDGSTLFAQDNRLWSTYYGGSNSDQTNSVAADAAGNVYMAGYTISTFGIASGGFQNSYGGGYDAFLVKFDAAGNRLWATYYGGPGFDAATGITTDAFGNVYLLGHTASASGIASGGFQNNIGGSNDAFLVKFDATTGNRLWATYFGATSAEEIYGVATDAIGNVYIAGFTSSTSGIASGGFQNVYGGGASDAFLVKFDSGGNRLWATYYGGLGDEFLFNGVGVGVATDASGNVYLLGQTTSISFISSAGFQNNYGGGTGDAFLVKFDSSGNRLWATYYGGTGYDVGYSIATDALSNVYLAGHTNSAVGISSGGFQNTYVGGGGFGYDGFLVKFDGSGSRLWATYYGGPDSEEIYSVATDASGNVYLGGDTYSTSGITSGGFQNSLAGTENLCVAKFDAGGNRLCATYFGILHDEEGHVAVDGFGNVYIAANTTSAVGIAAGGFQNTYGGGPLPYGDAFLAKFSSCFNNSMIVTVTSTTITCNGECNGQATATVSGGTGTYTYSWNTSPVKSTSTITGLCVGNYTVTVTDGAYSVTAAIVITEPPALVTTITATDVTIFVGDSTQLSATGGGTYYWLPSAGLSCSTCANPLATPTITTVYCVIVTDGNSCSDSACITITVELSCGTLFIPSAFSPNDDGENDILFVGSNCIKVVYFTIYDRWGEKVFETKDVLKGWDGKYKHRSLSSGVFVYYLDAILLTGEKINKKGNISLVR